MPDRRQAFRREPIEIDLGNDVIISVAPVDWLKRDDFGNEVLSQNAQIMNEAVHVYVDPDSGLPELEMKLAERFNDGRRLLELGLEDEAFKQVMAIPKLYRNQLTEILLAICDVNELPKLREILDPNFLSPTLTGGIVSNLLGAGTPKTEPGQDSSPQDSPTTTSEPEPTQKSEDSSTSSIDEKQTITAGT